MNSGISTANPNPNVRQAVVTVVYGSHAERLDETFLSFRKAPFLELHAFILGDHLPKRRFPEIHYHLRPHDPRFSHPMREADYRRWELIDELGVDYCLVVDGLDVACLQPLEPIPSLLRGAAVGVCVEHGGGRYLDHGLYTTNFFNAGVTFWDVAQSRPIRQEILQRGRARFRNIVDDQLSLNEVLHAHYFNQVVILPCQYNFRASLGPKPIGWPRVHSLDGVRIYHNKHWVHEALRRSWKPRGQLPSLPPDPVQPLPRWKQFYRRLLYRLRRIGT